MASPFGGNVPLQFPEAVQLVEFGEDQVIDVELPSSIVLEARNREGAGGATSVRLTELDADVPAPSIHVRV